MGLSVRIDFGRADRDLIARAVIASEKAADASERVADASARIAGAIEQIAAFLTSASGDDQQAEVDDLTERLRLANDRLEAFVADAPPPPTTP